MKKSKEKAYKNWELILMTTIIVSGIILQYGNVHIVISLSGQIEESTDILENFMNRELHAIDIVKYKELEK